jgi:hypothetical protein
MTTCHKGEVVEMVGTEGEDNGRSYRIHTGWGKELKPGSIVTLAAGNDAKDSNGNIIESIAAFTYEMLR